MKTVYRVEHEEHGYGPYLRPEDNDSGDFDTHYDIAGLHSAHNQSTAHPGPYQDGLLWEMNSNHYHGFDSLELLDKWFAGFKRKLHAAGFVIRVFEAPEDTTLTSDSGRQTIFVREDSKVVDTLPVVRYGKGTN